MAIGFYFEYKSIFLDMLMSPRSLENSSVKLPVTDSKAKKGRAQGVYFSRPASVASFIYLW
jgi:hypothetical protein